ncbi:Tetratricopeptide repeat [Chthonomonas calidirosea]|uniref:Tetratricopeptide repeat n=1 Tax=Chthonomonas calidirosea (strain DSM 23976 / ICMP 18418 / T49) TaxID=1303518 RepID=S0EXF7_CHTCT|nr:hypothetical protein [Chthonomonas calidirosea]CCW34478.1 Tetratricopeptide repeat [Chthonomonas calidirosea T49]CEK13444.1 Tetratricopeptide repeat [Chthonomonas calidirosea]CEK14668.1 Tetratricopeptide repeat [Chthonomonas calidirosea]
MSPNEEHDTKTPSSSTERTQAMSPLHGPEIKASPPMDERVLEVAQELIQQGITPEQAKKLLVAGGPGNDGSSPTGASQTTRGSGAEVSLSELIARKIEAQAEAVKKIDLGLPDFREATLQEKYEAERLQREAELLRRRERYREAEAKCREALSKNPKDALGLELLGDILQGLGRVDEAMAAYYRATLADPRRASAEKKFGDLLVKQQDWGAVITEDVEKHPFVGLLLSALLPGLGHCYYGETIRGLIYFVIDAILLAILLWLVPHSRGITVGLLGVALLALLYYCFVLIDMRLISRRTGGV